MILWPVAFSNNENHITVTLFVVLIQAPDEMSVIDEPGNVNNDYIAQGEGNKDRSLHWIVPVLEWSVDWKKYEENEVENPIKSENFG